MDQVRPDPVHFVRLRVPRRHYFLIKRFLSKKIVIGRAEVGIFELIFWMSLKTLLIDQFLTPLKASHFRVEYGCASLPEKLVNTFPFA